MRSCLCLGLVFIESMCRGMVDVTQNAICHIENMPDVPIWVSKDFKMLMRKDPKSQFYAIVHIYCSTCKCVHRKDAPRVLFGSRNWLERDLNKLLLIK